MAKRRISEADGIAAVRQVLGGEVSRHSIATAVRFLLEEVAVLAPGNSVEVRVPPYGATQCIAGPRHTRGTPPNVVEMSPETWIGVATGGIDWDAARADGRIIASGARADLSPVLPVMRAPR